jgi:hypothetical protein
MYFDNVLDIYRGGYLFLVLTTGEHCKTLTIKRMIQVQSLLHNIYLAMLFCRYIGIS